MLRNDIHIMKTSEEEYLEDAGLYIIIFENIFLQIYKKKYI